MTVAELANKFVDICRTGNFLEAYSLFHDDAEGLEPNGVPNAHVKGLENLRAKTIQFGEMTEERYGLEVSDPIVADNFFCVSMFIDSKMKGMPRMKMEELCMYEVKDGKIVKEQFFYTPPPMPA